MILLLFALISTLAWAFAPGPGAVAVTATLFGGYLIKQTEVALVARSTPKTPELELTNDPEFGIYNGYVCPTWEHNRLEKELGGSDFLSCGNEECPACFSKGKCAVAECNAAGVNAWSSGYRGDNVEYLCMPHWDIRQEDRAKLQETMKSKKEIEARQKAEEMVASIEAAKRLPADERWVNIRGQRIRRPAEVPDNAYGKWKYEHLNTYDPQNQVIWIWVDQDTGEKMSLCSFHSEAWADNPEWVGATYQGETGKQEMGFGPALDARGRLAVKDTPAYRKPRNDSGIKIKTPFSNNGVTSCIECNRSLMRFPFKNGIDERYCPDCVVDNAPILPDPRVKDRR